LLAADVDFWVEDDFELDEPESELLLEDSAEDEDDEVLVSFDSDLTVTSLPSLAESLLPLPLPSFDSAPLETSLLLSLRESVR